jgi:hypothetical protein
MPRFRFVSFPLALILTAGIAAAQATVKSESLPVYSQRDTRSTVVKTLHRGDAVEIEMSISGEGGLQWCSIHESGQTAKLGNVPCESLERPPVAKQTAPPAQTQTKSVAQPAARASGGVRDDFWETYPRSRGEERWVRDSVSFAREFRFSEEQKARVLQFARHVEIGLCIEDSDSYFRRGLIPPDMLSSTPGTTQCEWNAQTLREWVFSLVTPEQKAAHLNFYEFFSKMIASNRIALKRRSER